MYSISWIHRPLERQSARPLAAVAIAFAAGILSAQGCTNCSGEGIFLAGSLLAAASFFSLRRRRHGLALALVLAATAAAGFLSAVAQRDRFSKSDLRHLIAQRRFPLDTPVEFDACVVDDVIVRDMEIAYTLRLRRFRSGANWHKCTGKAILRVARFQHPRAESREANPKRGDRILGWGLWRRPDNYQNPGSADRVGRLSRRGIFLIGRTKSLRLLQTFPGGCAHRLIRPANAARVRVRERLEPMKQNGHGDAAAILSSLTIGDYSELTTDLSSAFQNSGTLHVLVVSGVHVAWIAGLLLGLFKLAHLPERGCYFLAATAVLAYTCIVGFQASISRCFWVFILFLAGRMLLRAVDPVNLLCAAALLLLAAHPDWIYDLGFQLSFLSVLAIVMTATPLIHTIWQPACLPMRHTGDPKRLFLKSGRWHRLGRRARVQSELFLEAITDSRIPQAAPLCYGVCRLAACALLAAGSLAILSFSVELWIEPIIARSYNRLCWIAPLANIVIVPLSSLALAAGFLVALTPDILGTAPLELARGCAEALYSAASVISRLPGAWQRCPTPPAGWVWGGISLLFLWHFWKWRGLWIPVAGIGILILVLALAPLISLPFQPRTEGLLPEAPEGKNNNPTLSFTFLDVGEGDSIVIRFPDNRLWLLDAGGLRLPPAEENGDSPFDIGESVVSRYLWERWLLRIDRVILTHTDADHAGGIPAVLNNFSVGQFAFTHIAADARRLGRILSAAAGQGIPGIEWSPGAATKVGEVTVRMLHPPVNSPLASANDNSIVLHFAMGRFSALLAGDLEKKGERELLSCAVGLRCSLLKVAHHGSRSATSDAFLEQTVPHWAVISAGRHNPFRHPAPDVLKRLAHHGARPLVTSELGAVTFETDGWRYAIHSHVQGLLERGNL